MSVHVKGHRISSGESGTGIEITIIASRSRPRHFEVPADKARGLIKLIEEYERPQEEVETVPASVVFKDLEKKYTLAGAALKGARLREGLTQMELAQKINVTQGDLSKMESGKRPIGKTIAKRLAKVLKFDYRVFL